MSSSLAGQGGESPPRRGTYLLNHLSQLLTNALALILLCRQGRTIPILQTTGTHMQAIDMMLARTHPAEARNSAMQPRAMKGVAECRSWLEVTG